MSTLSNSTMDALERQIEVDDDLPGVSLVERGTDSIIYDIPMTEPDHALTIAGKVKRICALAESAGFEATEHFSNGYTTVKIDRTTTEDVNMNAKKSNAGTYRVEAMIGYPGWSGPNDDDIFSFHYHSESDMHAGLESIMMYINAGHNLTPDMDADIGTACWVSIFDTTGLSDAERMEFGTGRIIAGGQSPEGYCVFGADILDEAGATKGSIALHNFGRSLYRLLSSA